MLIIIIMVVVMMMMVLVMVMMMAFAVAKLGCRITAFPLFNDRQRLESLKLSRELQLYIPQLKHLNT